MENRSQQNIFRGIAFVLFLTITVLFNYAFVAAYDEDAGDDDETNMAVEKSIVQKREKSPAIKILQRVQDLKPKPTLPTEKILIREINISGSTLLSENAINKINLLYKDKELTGKEMQRAADLISRAYSREGYITSYAYIAPDRLNQGILDIAVVEGQTGTIEIKGNKYFSTDLLMKKITLKKGEPFNFIKLNTDVFRINKAQDRKSSLELEPGPNGSTNIILTVKDKLPLHVTFQADNYGAETILYNRYKAFFIANNLTGHDDSLTIKVERSEGDAHMINDLDYIIPINNTWKFEYYLMPPWKVEDYYYKDNKDTDFEKRARKSYFWFYQSLINQPDCELVSSYGFTWIDIFWYKPFLHANNPTRQDKFRVLKWDLSLNRADQYGRWVITNDFQWAIPRVMGANKAKTDADTVSTSVVGGGSAYKKNLLTVARRQKLVAGIDLLAKARWQLSSTTLTGVNDFSVGGYCGVIDNRGYPRTQAPADGGRAITLGFSLPAYFVPRTMNAPLSKTKLYDALKLFTFWDWAQAVLKSPKLATVAGDPNDKKITTLSSAGLGFTYTVPDQNLAIRLDAGWPLNHKVGIDGDHHHIWWSVTKGF